MTESDPTKSKRKISIRRVLIPVICFYLLLCLTACSLQRRLLYFPTKIPADVVVQSAAEHGLSPWKNPAGQIIGWKIPAKGPAIGSVLIMHGNAGSAIGRDYIAQPIHDAAPLDVYILEYPGYGARSGSPSKSSFDAAGEEAFELLPHNLPRYLVSESLGTGVAADLAQAHPSEVAGIAMLAPYHNLAWVAQRQFWFLPAYLVFLDRFNPQAALRSYRGPVKFAIAEKDEVVTATSGRRLAESYQGPKEIQIFPGAGHNDISAEPPAWWRDVLTFWQTGKASR